jgi:hypothetical protein
MDGSRSKISSGSIAQRNLIPVLKGLMEPKDLAAYPCAYSDII